MKTWLVFITLGLLVAAPAMAQWVEQGDAGDLPTTAQIPLGTGPLTTITGNNGASDVDMYCIQVTDAGTFSASTCAPGAAWDTQLFLFRSDGVGVITNDDACSLQSIIPGFANCQNSVGPGLYYIAISKYNKDPLPALSTSNGCNTFTAPITGWNSNTTTAGGAYTITFTSTTYCGTVATEPTTWGTIKSLYR